MTQGQSAAALVRRAEGAPRRQNKMPSPSATSAPRLGPSFASGPGRPGPHPARPRCWQDHISPHGVPRLERQPRVRSAPGPHLPRARAPRRRAAARAPADRGACDTRQVTVSSTRNESAGAGRARGLPPCAQRERRRLTAVLTLTPVERGNEAVMLEPSISTSQIFFTNRICPKKNAVQSPEGQVSRPQSRMYERGQGVIAGWVGGGEHRASGQRAARALGTPGVASHCWQAKGTGSGWTLRQPYACVAGLEAGGVLEGWEGKRGIRTGENSGWHRVAAAAVTQAVARAQGSLHWVACWRTVVIYIGNCSEVGVRTAGMVRAMLHVFLGQRRPCRADRRPALLFRSSLSGLGRPALAYRSGGVQFDAVR